MPTPVSVLKFQSTGAEVIETGMRVGKWACSCLIAQETISDCSFARGISWDGSLTVTLQILKFVGQKRSV